METPPADPSPMEGLENAPVYQYKGIRSLRGRIDSQTDALQADRSNQQYLVFHGITKKSLLR